MTLPCGNCRAVICGPKEDRPGDPMLEIRNEYGRKARCVPCAKALFGEDAPVEFPDEEFVVPQPNVVRHPDFVTTKQIAQSVRFNNLRDFRRLASGDRE